MLLYVNKQGFILLTILIFLQVIALFSWYAMHAALLAAKETRNNIYSHEVDDSAEFILQQIESNLHDGTSSCTVPVTSTYQLIRQPLTWWQSSVTCAGIFQRFQYYYVTELLGDDFCARIEGNEGQIARYWRVTLLMSDRVRDVRRWLQTTIVKAYLLSDQCKQNMSHRVKTGRQSWRELVEVN